MMHKTLKALQLPAGVPAVKDKVGLSVDPTLIPTLNPRLRHQEKVRDVIELIARFGFASASTITLASGNKRRGFAKELHEEGILTCRTISGLIVDKKGVSAIYGLTRGTAASAGVNYVDIWKIKSSRAAHALILQFETLRARGGHYRNLVLIDYKVETRLVGGSVRYDAVWHVREGTSTTGIIPVAVEAERSGKYGRELELFFTKLLFASSRSLVLFEDEGLMRCYLEHAQRYKDAGSIPHWKCTDGEWWQLRDPKAISAGRWDEIEFRLTGTDFAARLSEDLAFAIGAIDLMGPLY